MEDQLTVVFKNKKYTATVLSTPEDYLTLMSILKGSEKRVYRSGILFGMVSVLILQKVYKDARNQDRDV